MKYTTELPMIVQVHRMSQKELTMQYTVTWDMITGTLTLSYMYTQGHCQTGIPNKCSPDHRGFCVLSDCMNETFKVSINSVHNALGDLT